MEVRPAGHGGGTRIPPRRRKDGNLSLIAHDSYLINLAAKEDALLQKSREAFLDEMRRAETLGLDFVVTHMGAHTGAGEEAGIARGCANR